MSRILFIGLGNMGLPMAINLVKAGHQVKGFDISEKALASFSAAGGKVTSSMNTDAEDVEYIVTMLPSGEHVSGLLERDGLLDSAAPGTIFIDTSTIDFATSQRLAKLAQSKKHSMIDAPVSGGTAGAANGTLTFMIGGAKDTLEKSRHLFEAMGKNIFHAGAEGSGQITKACNNMLLAIHMIGTSEAINLGVSLGLDPKTLSEIMSKSSGSNWSLTTYNPHPGVMETAPASREYSGGFAVDLMCKDLGLALESALAKKVSIPLGHAAYDLYKIHSQSGAKHLDFSSIIRLLRPSEAARKRP